MQAPVSEPTPSRAPEGRGKVPEGSDLIIPVMSLAFAAYFFSTISDLGWEAKANGVVIGSVLAALSVLQIGRIAHRVLGGRSSLSLEVLTRPVATQFQRLALVALLAAFVLLIDYTGTTLGLFLMMAGAMYLLKVRDWRWLVCLPGGCAALVYVLFILFLKARLPAGPIEKLIALLTG